MVSQRPAQSAPVPANDVASSATGDQSKTAKPVQAAADQTFTPQDRDTLESLRKPQADQLVAQIKSCTATLEKLASAKVKPTDHRVTDVKKRRDTLEAAKTKLMNLSLVDVGASMCRKAQGLLGQSASLQFTSGMFTEVSKQMAAEPGQHVVETNRFGNVVSEYDTDNTGPAMLGMLLGMAAQARSEQSKADADTIVKAVQSLSPAAQAAIADRMAKEDAEAKTAKQKPATPASAAPPGSKTRP